MSSPPNSRCCVVDPNTISASDRTSWCSANRTTCDTLCGGRASDNTCDNSTLDQTCKCSSGFEPNLSEYANTVPSLMCQKWQSDCIAAAPGDLTAQQQCRTTTCGSKRAEAAVSSDSSASSSTEPTPAPSSTSSSTAASQTSTESSGTRTQPSTTRSSSSTSATRTGASGGTETSGGAGGNQGGTNSGTPAPGAGGLNTGAKAGIAVGVILGVVIIALVFFLLRRRSKKRAVSATTEPWEPYKPSDEKQVAIPTASEISQKPELHGDPAVDYRSDPTQHQYPSAGQWQQPQAASELYSSNEYPTELHGTGNPVELHSLPRNEIVEPVAVSQVTPPVQTPQDTPLPIVTALTSPSHSYSPRLGIGQPLSAEDIQALEEEERRIDAEMAEVERMKELREQKFAIQQKLRDAKRM